MNNVVLEARKCCQTTSERHLVPFSHTLSQSLIPHLPEKPHNLHLLHCGPGPIIAPMQSGLTGLASSERINNIHLIQSGLGPPSSHERPLDYPHPSSSVGMHWNRQPWMYASKCRPLFSYGYGLPECQLTARRVDFRSVTFASD